MKITAGRTATIALSPDLVKVVAAQTDLRPDTGRCSLERSPDDDYPPGRGDLETSKQPAEGRRARIGQTFADQVIIPGFVAQHEYLVVTATSGMGSLQPPYHRRSRYQATGKPG